MPDQVQSADWLPRPAEVCRRLLAALEASEGRRRRRNRNTEPDAIGMTIKRRLLQQAVAEDPDPHAFEGWLLRRTLEADASRPAADQEEPLPAGGPVRAMALEVLAEWRLAGTSGAFRDWLFRGAPSDDAASR